MAELKRKLRPGVLLLALSPGVPILLALYFHSFPEASEPYRVNLLGEWLLSEDTSVDASPHDIEDGNWDIMRFPGNYWHQGFASKALWLRKHFDLKPKLLDENLFFILGSTRNSFIEVYVNGHFVGEQGVPKDEYKMEQSGVEGWYVPKGILRSSDNVVAMRVYMNSPTMAGVLDSRLMIGHPQHLKPYLDMNRSIKAFFEYGAIMSFILGMMLFAFLLILEWRDGDRYKYITAILLLATLLGYLVGKAGFILTPLMPFDTMMKVIANSITLMILVAAEFFEHYLLGRVTRIRKVNRVVCACILLIGFVADAFGFPANDVYMAFIYYLFLFVLYLVYLSVRDVFNKKSEHKYSVLLAAAVVVVLLSGANDLLTDAQVFNTPRLFTFAIANIGLLVIVVVIGDFMRLSQRNKELSLSLEKTNEELADALVQTKESARVKSAFLANTSHELRSPLNSIINIPDGLIEDFAGADVAHCSKCGEYFSLEQDDAVDQSTACPSCRETGSLSTQTHWNYQGTPKETIRYLRSISNSGKHLLRVVNDILDISKLEAGRMTLVLEEVAVNELIDEVLLTMAPLAEKAKVEIEVLPLPSGLSMEMDRVKISQVLINLIGNAIKFSPEEQKVAISVAEEDNSAVFRVRDWGIGISEKDQGLIFDSFRQVEGGNTRRFGGTGLGLAITKQVVELHKGVIWVESQLEQGSTFCVRLPHSHLEEKAEAEQIQDRVDDNRPLVLIVDDDRSSLEAASLALTKIDCRVEVTSDPTRALELVEKLHPELVILDIMMPRISGITILQEIRKRQELQQRVLVSSAYYTNRGIVETLGAKWLAKPWSTDELPHKVRQILGLG